MGKSLVGLALVSVLVGVSGRSLAEPADLLLSVANPHGYTYWGTELASCKDGSVLVGSHSSFGGFLGGVDVPVYRVDILTGQIVQTYEEPWLTPYINHMDMFGDSGIAEVGDYVLIGANATLGAPQAGCVHVYDSDTGDYVHTLGHPSPCSSGSFGMAIAALGDLAVVGTFYDGTSSGAAYIIDPFTGAVTQKLVRPEGSPSDNFGNSVAVSGNDVIVGGTRGPVYRFDSTTGQVMATYTDPGMYGLFGYAVANAGDKVLVGAFKANVPEEESGVVHVFNSYTGEHISTIENPYPHPGDWFGIEIEVYEDRYALVGASNTEFGGTAYLYDLEDLSLVASFMNPDGCGGARFGENIAWASGAAVISAWRDNVDVGNVYVFEGYLPEPFCPAALILGAACLLRRTRPGQVAGSLRQRRYRIGPCPARRRAGPHG